MMIRRYGCIQLSISLLLLFESLSHSHAAALTTPAGQQFSTGQTVFEEQCSGCHGEDGVSGNAADIRGVPQKDIELAIRGVEDMPEIELTPEQINAVTIYLDYLATSAPEK
nr:cytochrome c [uncultured Cohaesibacter sp.]